MAAEAVSPSIKSLFRTFNRELRKSSLIPRSFASRRQDALPTYVRNMLRDPNENIQQSSASRIDNLTTLLRNQRIHGELLARYNPVYGKSEQERIRATANRVGLEVPDLYEDVEATQAEGIDVKYRS